MELTAARQSQLKTDAEVLRHLVRVGLATVEDVITWADTAVASLATPSDALIDLCLAGQRPAPIVESLLQSIAGVADASAVHRRVMGGFLHALRAAPDSADALAKHLFLMANDEALLGTLEVGEMLSWWDRLDLAKGGTFGDYVEVRQALDAWLVRMSAR